MIGSQSRCSPAYGSSISDSTPSTRQMQKSCALSARSSRSADFPIPASPRTPAPCLRSGATAGPTSEQMLRVVTNDELEMGDGAVVSEADDGYWISTWTWVGDEGRWHAAIRRR